MKRFIFIICLISINSLISKFSLAQSASLFVGFYDGTKMELVFNLYILPNHEFVVKFIYGSEDRVVIGTWKEIGSNKIKLNETRDENEPFIVYAAKEGNNSRTLGLINFDPNAGNALSFGNIFNPSTLKYIIKPEESYPNNEYYLNKSMDSSSIIYLTQPLSLNSHKVYDFEPAKNETDIIITYNNIVDEPLFNVEATFTDSVLSIEDNKQKQILGKKQKIPSSFMDHLKNIEDINKIPETIEKEQNGIKYTYRRIYPKKTFLTNVTLDVNQAYF